MATRKVLVVGATGKQGSAVIDALLRMPVTTPPIHILALTRNVESAGSQALVAKQPTSITLVKGSPNDLDPSLIFAANAPIAAMFLMTMPGKEDIVGKTWVNTALDNGVEQIVLSTVDRGGNEKSWDTPTDVTHFYEKHEIELHLRAKAEVIEKTGKHLSWTIFRPTAFLDNLNPGVFGKVFAAMWSTLPAALGLQFISAHDVGVFAAKALVDPKGWDRKAVSLAGDEITYPQAKQIFEKVVGQELPQTWTFLGQGMLWAIGDVGKMFRFFEKEGYGADIAALRAEEPALQNFETWLRESSGWAKQIK